MPGGAAEDVEVDDVPAVLPGDGQTVLPDGVRIRTAVPDDRLDVVRVLDGAMLRTESIPGRIRNDEVLVAVAERGSAEEDPSEAVVGAAVLETRDADRRLDAVAVRRTRRDRGIGSVLVARAVREARELAGVSRFTAEFDADLRAFYDGLGFEIEPVASSDATPDANAVSDRLRGRLDL